ncbi:MAG: universal stress protein [Pseudomonadota bacterium]|nr:universal stress protein [Pseudomonadota bacterium]
MFSSVLLAIDLNHEESWKKALPAAVELAGKGKGKLHVVTVVPDFGMASVEAYFPPDFETKALQSAEKNLEAFIAKHLSKGPGATPHVGHGKVYDQILRTAEKVKADVIVLSGHRPDMKTYLMGSNAEKVVRHFARSVLLVR